MLLLAAPLMLVTASADADPPDQGRPSDPATAWLDHAATCLEGVRFLEADFTQQLLHRLKSVHEPMTGRLQLGPNGRIRLDYDQPKPMLLISDGKKVRAWDPETRTVFESRARDGLTAQALGLALDGPGQKHFAVRFVGGARAPSKGGLAVVELRPKAVTSLAERIVLTLTAKCPPVRRITIIDRAGTASRIDLINQRVNPEIGNGRFLFKPPKGAKIVKQ
jgi:outer membrane lipoprotein-sorting protein